MHGRDPCTAGREVDARVGDRSSDTLTQLAPTTLGRPTGVAPR
jgi:hypothetical protein